jgi:hypothetical protein
MLNRNFAQTIAQIGYMTRPKVTEGKSIDFAGAIDAYYKAKDRKQAEEDRQLDKDRRDALTNAINNDETLSDTQKALFASDPNSYASFLQGNQNLANQRAMADYNHSLDMKKQDALYKLKNDLEVIKGGYGTAAMQNASYLVNQGYTPEQANAMAFSGQNPAFAQIYPSLGKEGAKKTDQEIGKNYASDLDEYNNMVSKMPELEETVARLKELAPNATYTKFGRIYDIAKKELTGKSTEGGVAREEYDSIISNQVLPLMRDTFGAQFTEKEGETLRKTLGDVNKTPEEKVAALNSFITQKQKSIESKYRKLKSYEQGFGVSAYNQTPSDEDAWGGI